MTEDMKNKNMAQTAETTTAQTVTVPTAENGSTQEHQKKYSLEYVLEQIELISRQNEYIQQVLSELRQMETGGAGDVGAQAKAMAFGNIVESREATNQQLLRMYEKMYDDLKPTPLKLSGKEQMLQVLTDSVSAAIVQGTYTGDEVSAFLAAIRQL